jgi:CYTH domain-containing protein
MNKMGLLKVINPVLFPAFLLQVVTSLIMFFRIKIPHAPVVFEIHEYNGLFIIGLIIAHIVLNWGWVKATYFKKIARKT